jgi:hypothetical protein
LNIFKYQLFLGKNPLFLPKGSEILTVQTQNEEIMVWTKEPLSGDREYINVHLLYSGKNTLTENLEYIGTAQLHNLVYHAFQEHNK